MRGLGTRNRFLRYGICVPCSKRLPGVRDAFSGGIRCKKQASTVRKRYSVPKTASSGTRRIFKGPQNSRLHRLWTASCRTGRIFSARNAPRSEVSRHKKRDQSQRLWSLLSGYCDSNTGPSGPKPDALANCATPRISQMGLQIYTIFARVQNIFDLSLGK